MVAPLSKGCVVKLKTALFLLISSALVNFVAAHALDRIGLMQGLLAPSGARLALLLPTACVFYLARFCALFVAPGLLFGALARVLLGRLAARGG